MYYTKEAFYLLNEMKIKNESNFKFKFSGF